MYEWSELVRLQAVVWREGRLFVAVDPCTGVASQGCSAESALKNLVEAVSLALE